MRKDHEASRVDGEDQQASRRACSEFSFTKFTDLYRKDDLRAHVLSRLTSGGWNGKVGSRRAVR